MTSCQTRFSVLPGFRAPTWLDGTAGGAGRDEVVTALAGETLDEAGDELRPRDGGDLQVAGDEGPVAEETPEQRLLQLHGRDLRQPHRCRPAAHDAVLDEQLLGRQDDV